MRKLIQQGERMGTNGPECRGSYQRVALRFSEQLQREYECGCGRVLRVRLSERTGEATIPRHRVEKQAPVLGVGSIISGPRCHFCNSDLWRIGDGQLVCHGMIAGRECAETMAV